MEKETLLLQDQEPAVIYIGLVGGRKLCKKMLEKPSFDYMQEDAIGRKCYEIFQQIDQPCSSKELPCPLNEVIRNKHHCRQVRTRLGSDKKQRHIEVNVYPIWEKDGKISKFIHISRDITQHKRKEEEITRSLEQMVDERTRQLKETHDKLLHQDKMASLGKLSASVVHEINNPIAGILNLTKLMQRIITEEALNFKEIDPFNRYLNLMETETNRISRIVSNLLSFARESKMEFNELNPLREHGGPVQTHAGNLRHDTGYCAHELHDYDYR